MGVQEPAAYRPAHLMAAAALAAAGLAACGAVAGGPPAGTASPVPTAPVAARSGGVPRNTPPPVSRVIVARDADNGRSLTLRVGDHLDVVLASTYWQVQGSTDQSVVRQAVQPTVAPQPGGCAPGQGCGTVDASFVAVGAGRADVTARRTSCGEALNCTGSQGTFRVTVLVAG